MTGTEAVRLRRAVRLAMSFDDGPSWEATNLVTRVRHSITPVAAAICMATAARPGSSAQIHQLIEPWSEVGVDEVSSKVASLQERGLVLSGSEREPSWMGDLQRSWARCGWAESADYYLASLGAPQSDQSQVRLPLPANSGNAETECHNGIDRISAAIITRLTMTALQKVTDESGDSTSALPISRFFKVFLCAIDLPDIEPGHYRLNPPSAVVRVGRLGDPRDLYFGPFRARFPVRALLVFAADFRTGTKGFRDPQALRQLFMTAGQVMAAVDLSARSLGIKPYGQHGMRDEAVEALLGGTLADCGAMFAVALGDDEG